jgi:hypothetical protein
MATAAPQGLLAEFAGADALLAAARRARAAGYTRLDAYSPFAVEGLADVLDVGAPKVRPVMLVAGILGAGLGLGLQLYSATVAYPINSGGRPLASLPAFIPTTFEFGILFAALAGFVTFLASAGLPRPHHPIFDARGFERASDRGFFLEIAAADPRFDADETRRFLDGLSPRRVEVLP